MTAGTQMKWTNGLTFVTVVGTVAGCGGGGSGSGGGQQPQPTPDFTLSFSSSSLSLTAGATGSTTASVTGTDGFTSVVTLQMSGLPAGITCCRLSHYLSYSDHAICRTVASGMPQQVRDRGGPTGMAARVNLPQELLNSESFAILIRF